MATGQEQILTKLKSSWLDIMYDWRPVGLYFESWDQPTIYLKRFCWQCVHDGCVLICPCWSLLKRGGGHAAKMLLFLRLT